MKGGRHTVRIGGASGFWGDSSTAVPQLLKLGAVNYLVFDYLAEVTMSLLAAARLKDREAGYATDFVRTIKENLYEIKARGIRLVANAGGVNPRGCAAAVEAMARDMGMALKVACVEGDDVMPLAQQLRREGVREIHGDRPLPDALVSANAYLGALPIKAALDAGAEVVITGRCVDSAVTLGVLMHEFQWAADDYDKLAQASMAGHIIECGCQATGGLFTDWRAVPDWENMGYPVLECEADGSFIVTKGEPTGGLVSVATVAEQVLYEVGDPRSYLLPDVICDFTNICLTQAGPNRVCVTGVRGRRPTPFYKVSATFQDGFKSTAQITLIGAEARDKARRTAEAILAKTREIFRQQSYGDYSETLAEFLGSESNFGAHSGAEDVREVVLRLSVAHTDKRALEIFAREIAPSGCAFSPGTTGITGRPRPTPTIKQFAFLIDKARLSPAVWIDGERISVPIPSGGEDREIDCGKDASEASAPDASLVKVPLIKIARGRSGDKGDISNIGVIARSPELLPYLRQQVTPAAVKAYLSHLVLGEVQRFDVPGMDAVNFLCGNALGGGGIASLRNDPFGKGMAQILLSMPVRAPAALIESVSSDRAESYWR